MAGQAVFQLCPPQGRACAIVFVDLGVVLVAVETPTHLEGVDPLGHCHLLGHVAVALSALNTAANVALVTEVDEVREIVNLLPRDGLARLVEGRELLELRPPCPRAPRKIQSPRMVTRWSTKKNCGRTLICHP